LTPKKMPIQSYEFHFILALSILLLSKKIIKNVL
jgi:hypothetical protein